MTLHLLVVTVRLPCAVSHTADVNAGDALVVVACCRAQLPESLQTIADQAEKLNPNVWKSATVHLLPFAGHRSGRLILSTTGPVDRDFDDVRAFKQAAQLAVKSAVSYGSRSPTLVVLRCDRFVEAPLITVMGALQSLYIPLETREATGDRGRADSIHLHLPQWAEADAENFVNTVIAIEKGRTVHRDIGGGDPERMAPPRVADYVKEAFAGSKAIKVEVVSDQAVISKEYPLMAAVNRCANTVPRHQSRLIKLVYEGHGEIEETLMLVGKGVTLDTGGADLKVNGVMYGMSRDKLGATTIAGFMKSLEELRPAGVKVIAYLCMVRNSIGAESYTCDEVITARSGSRIRIVNTDAEGRLTMLDPLCQIKEMALKEKNPHIYTIATLTGHAVIAYGDYFSAVMDNGPARAVRSAENLHEAGAVLGDYVEISRLRKEDFDFNLIDTGDYNDVRQCNTGASSRTPRGHQAPGAFLQQASGLVNHGCNSTQPLKYTHIDMASAEGEMDVPYGRPLLAFINRYLLKRFKAIV